ncbi:hypothetical protein ACA910_002159 [Epithemia clementina (nom. ined.)]
MPEDVPTTTDLTAGYATFLAPPPPPPLAGTASYLPAALPPLYAAAATTTTDEAAGSAPLPTLQPRATPFAAAPAPAATPAAMAAPVAPSPPPPGVSRLYPELEELPDLRARVRRHVHTVLHCLPLPQTQAYREAMRRDASLVDTETDPLQFVRYCKYDILQGAKRLCLYWTERLKLFGPTRAFLPLTLTGTGALTDRDVATLRAGYPALIAVGGGSSSSSSSSPTETVLYVDRRRKIATTTTDQHLRAVFYCIAILAADPNSQLEGARVMYMALTPRDHKVDFALIRRGAVLLTTCFPIRSKVSLICVPLQKRPLFSQRLIDGMVLLMRQYLLMDFAICMPDTTTGGGKSENAADNSSSSIVDQLVALGFDLQYIPQSFGGHWSFDDYEQWFLDRQHIESEMYKDRLLKRTPNTTTTTPGAAAAYAHPTTTNLFPRNSTVTSSITGLISHGFMPSPSDAAAAAGGVPSAATMTESSFPLMTGTTRAAPLLGMHQVGTAPVATIGTAHFTVQQQGQLPFIPALEPQNSLHQTAMRSPEPPASVATAAAVNTTTKSTTKEEERLAKKRMSNLLSSRKARDRFTKQVQTLQEQQDQLRRAQERLRVEHVTLSRLCSQAEETVRNILQPDHAGVDDDTEE